MSRINKSLSDALGINDGPVIDHEPLPSQEVAIVEEAPVPAIVDTQKDIPEDYKLSRDTFHSLIRVGSKAIEDVAQLAAESESAKAYEVLAKLIETVSGATKDLYDLQKKTKELTTPSHVDTKKPIDETNINVEKAVFVGTTADLLKEMKAEKENKK